MQLKQACTEFLQGYFSTHERSKKTEAAYQSDLAQFRAFANEEVCLSTLNGSLIEQWAAHLREEEYAPASIRRKMVVLKVFCSYWVRKGELHESPFWRVKLSFGRIEQLPRALKVLNALLLALEERNQPASWPEQENALLAVSIDGEAVRFSLSELTDSAPHILTPSEVNHPWSAPKYDYSSPAGFSCRSPTCRHSWNRFDEPGLTENSSESKIALVTSWLGLP